MNTKLQGSVAHLTGEVLVCLKPPWPRHWHVAGALGIALTVQGVAAIARSCTTPTSTSPASPRTSTYGRTPSAW